MPVPKVVLHIGAHKTATTYLQARLSKSANILRQMQVGCVDLDAFRDAQTRAGGLRAAEPRYAFFRRRALRRELGALVQQQVDRGAKRVFLTDENILGTLQDWAPGPDFYARAGSRLHATVEALDSFDLEIAFSVRSYAGFLTSVWGHRTLREGFAPFDPTVAVPFLDGGRGWAEVVADIRMATEGRPLRFWAYEDFSHHEASILTTLLGQAGRTAVEPISWQAMRGLTAPAVARLTALHQAGEVLSIARIQEVARAFCASQGYRRHDPWPADTASQLAERYRADLDRIAKMTGVERIAAEAELADAA